MRMARTPNRLSDTVREAVKNHDGQRRTLCRAAGIDEGLLSHFMAGRKGLSVASLERLAEVLGLELFAPRKRRRKGKT